MMHHYPAQRSRTAAAPAQGRVIASSRSHRGFTIVELMVSMLLGIVLVGGTISLYLGNQQSFRVTQNLGRIQENGRLAFDLLGRDIREAGSTPCGIKAVANVIRTTGRVTPWWADWNNGTLVGYDGNQVAPAAAFGTTAASRVRGTDGITVIRGAMDEARMSTIQAHAPDDISSVITINTITGIQVNDPVIACDMTSGAILEAGTLMASPNRIVYTNRVRFGGSWNCTSAVGYPQPNDCSGTTTKTFAVGGSVTMLESGFWYIGVSPVGSPTFSLYREPLLRRSLTGAVAQEMVRDVSDMQIEYLTRDRTLDTNDLATSWAEASSPTFAATAGGWRELTIGANAANNQEVVAVRVTLTLTSPDRLNVEGIPVTRRTFAVFKLRNRETKAR